MRTRPAGRGPRPSTSTWYRVEDPAAVVAGLRRGPRIGVPAGGGLDPPPSALQPWEVEERPRIPLGHLTEHQQHLLLQALDDGGPVELDYCDADGAVTTRVVEDLEEDDHLLLGWCHLRDDERHFLPSRILAVRPAR